MLENMPIDRRTSAAFVGQADYDRNSQLAPVVQDLQSPKGGFNSYQSVCPGPVVVCGSLPLQAFGTARPVMQLASRPMAFHMHNSALHDEGASQPLALECEYF